MDRDPFSIHPVLEAHIRKQSEEESHLLEESILAEGCRDPLVVWEEENVLVDGHHRLAICRRHGIPYSVVYRSFSDIEAAKAWMDLNQLGRRNLSKEDRDTLIRRLAEAGHRQKDIAQAVGMSEARISQITKNKNLNNLSENPIKTSSAADEIAALQEKVRLLENLRQGHREHDDEMHDEIEELQRRLIEAEQRQPEPVIVEKPVIPPDIQKRLEEQDAQLKRLNTLHGDEQKAATLRAEIEALKKERSKAKVEASFDGVITLIMTHKTLAKNLVELARNGDLTIQQIDDAENMMDSVICAADDVKNAIRDIRGQFKKGGGLRVL
jgi:chromosome segregation ATPase